MIDFSGDIFAPDGRILLRSVACKLERGGKVVVCGPNGCGKSTLLRRIAGIGDISLQSTNKTLDKKISYIPTRPLDLLLPWLAVHENIIFFYTLANLNNDSNSPTLADQFSHALAGMGVDINILAKRDVYHLSSGQQALISLYCSLIQCPAIIVADEIFGTLSEKIRELVAHFFRDHCVTCLFASHDSKFVADLGARILDLEPYIAHECITK
ncbi:MAG: ATP-binding cassette domain-containing protein [Magnetococcales bacterium]|nr:ATP-binding cassette domain-containing protein [Magnetococcales bacterium]